jgi:hypothetical protein
MGNLGKEYGKKFDSIEDLEVEKAIVTREPPSIALPSLPVQPSGRELPNLIGLLPGEFPTSEIEGTGQPNSKVYLLSIANSNV